MTADWLSAISAAASAVAVLLAGGFAYMRFVRGRAHRSNLDLAVQPQLTQIDGLPAVLVRAVIKNTGTLRLTFDQEDCAALVEVFAVNRAVWNDALREGTVLWTAKKVAGQNLLIDEMVPLIGVTLEPGEVVEETVLLPVRPQRSYLAYRATLTVIAAADPVIRVPTRRQAEIWVTHSILVP